MSAPTGGGIGASVAAFWQERNSRERAMLTLAIVVIVLALIYAVLIGPALSGREQLTKNLPLLRQQAAELQLLTKQSAQLAGAGAPVAPISRETVDASLARRGLKAQNLVVSGGMVKLELTSASFTALLEWTDEMQKTARLSMVEANVVALAPLDSVNATLTLRQQRNEE